MTSALALYGEMLRRPEAQSFARFADGSRRRARIERWTAAADAVDERALAGLAGPVLDIGCGPGRHLAVLGRRGIPALGIDLSPVAVDLARELGAWANVGSIFDELPGCGRWESALLLDGNIGIGGRPERLLTRVHELLVTGGHVLIELAPPTRASTRTKVRLESGVAASEWFEWAEVSAADGEDLLGQAGLVATRRWEDLGRWFVVARAL